MHRMILIAGLPGAGKSHLLDGLKRGGWITFDDPKDLREIEPFLADGYCKHSNIAIADPHFCRESTRKKVEEWVKGRALIWWIFFENDANKCRNNVRFRESKGDNRKVMGYITQLSKVYHIPSNATVLKIWQST